MRILIGHLDTELPEYDTDRFDVRIVRSGKNGMRLPQTIAEMLEQCPPGWKPDVYYQAALVHFPIPADIEDFDGLTVTDIQDWHRGGRAVWAGTGFFDLVVTERNPCALLKASGYENAEFARFWGVNPNLHRILPDVEKDIDILFIGSLNAAVWEERNRWLERVARLSSKYRVVIAMGHYGEHYVRLTNRAKIVFNRSVNGCTNQRAYDGSACGALVFNEDSNAETKEIFTDRVHCVYYDDTNFESRIDHYLAHDSEREALVAAGRALVLAEHTESAHLNTLFQVIEANLDKVGYRPYTRLPHSERCLRKAFQIYSGSRPAGAEEALALLDEAEREGADKGLLLEARAALHGWVGHYVAGAEKIKVLTAALDLARQAVKALPQSALAQMTLGFLLLERAEATQGAHPTGRNDIMEAAVALSQAAERCETALRENAMETSDLVGFGYPRWSDGFDAHVERATLLRGIDEAEWARAMRAAVAWRCRSMLSDLAYANGQREEAHRQAEAASFDLPTEAEGLLRLARCEAVGGYLESALVHYQEGLARMPFAYNTWPELVTLLIALGRREEADAFVQDRLRIVDAIPSFAAIRQPLREALKMGM